MLFCVIIIFQELFQELLFSFINVFILSHNFRNVYLIFSPNDFEELFLFFGIFFTSSASLSKPVFFSSVCISRILFVSIVFDSGSTFVSLPSPPFVSSGLKKFFSFFLIFLSFRILFFLNLSVSFLIFFLSLSFPCISAFPKLFPSRSYIPRQIPIIITDSPEINGFIQ